MEPSDFHVDVDVFESVGQLVVINERDEVIGVVTSLDIARQVAMRAGYLAA